MSNLINHNKFALILIAVVGMAVVVSLSLVDAIPQDADYHAFSDADTLFGIPNALNVLSNIPFLLVGVAGLSLIISGKSKTRHVVESNKLAYVLFFTAVSLVALGSGYYHLKPTNETLLWDRIPMTIAFMALYSIVIGEFVSEKIGRLCLLPFVCLGIASVLYWSYTESIGMGDLRYYAIVQFFPLVTIPIIILFYKPRFEQAYAYWWLLAAYVAAKLFETFDSSIHEFLFFTSGHSLKHLVSALGLYILLRSYKLRLPS